MNLTQKKVKDEITGEEKAIDVWVQTEEEDAPIVERPIEEIEAEILQNKINEAKAYLVSTDYKMTVDYFATLPEAEQVQLTQLRAEARAFIRANEVI